MKLLLRAGLFFLAVVAATLGAAAAAHAANPLSWHEAMAQVGSATITSDKPDYSPGEIVTLTGTGWQPGETVTLHFVESPLLDTHPDLTAVADANGNIFNNQFSPDLHDVNVTFTVTAVGSLSGLQAQTTFTDSDALTVAISPTGGGTVTSSPSGISCPTTCTHTFSGGTGVTMTAAPATGFVFGHWTVTGTTLGTTCTNNSTTNPCSFTTPGGGGNATTLTAVFVFPPPTITKGFAPTAISVGGTSTLTITITNPSSTTTQTGVAVSDTFPSGVQVAATPNLTNTCTGGTVSGATAGSGTISLSGASIPASSSCAVSVSVAGTTSGAKNNTTGNVSSTNGGTGGTASATLIVFSPPTIAKTFAPTSTAVNTGTSTLTITISNPAANGANALTGVAVSDTFPSGMLVAGTPNATNTCGGTFTATAATNNISLSGGTVPGSSGSCAVSVSVTSTTAGVNANTTGNVSSTNGGTGGTASANLAVEVPPTITKAFAPTSVATGTSSTLTITITNPTGTNTVSLTGVTVTDTFPPGLVVQTPNGASNNCGGTFTAAAGSGSVSLGGAGGTIATGASCTLTVNVTSATVGTYNNTTGNVSSTNGGTGTTSNTASVTFTTPPTISKSFAPTTIPLNGISTLTLTITNPSATQTQTGIAVDDTFPAGMAVAASPNIGNTCGATFAPLAGATSLSVTNGSLPVSGSCQVKVDVTATTGGAKNNTTGTVSSTNGGTGNTASATLTVVAPPTITKSFGSGTTGIPVNGTSTMTITITNPTGNGATLTGVAVSDTFPAGMTVSTALTTTCTGGTLTGNGVGSNSFSLSGATINVGANCTITGSVTDNTAGAAVNTTGNVSSTNGGTGLTATATLPVEVPPTITKAFAPANIGPGGTSTLTITFTNPTGNTVTLTGLTVSDTYPSGLVNASSPNRTNTCGGSSSGSSGGNTLALTGTGNSVAAGASCTLSINVTAASAGSYVNTTGNVSSTNAGTGTSATATLTVNSPPTITKGFAPSTIAVGGISTLTLTITNPPSNTVALTGVAVSDTFPAGVTVDPTPSATNSCGGTFTANANASNISLTNGSIPVNSFCAVSVHVTATTAGSKNNTTGAVSAANGGTGTTASATLTVVAPPTITKSFNPTTTQINTLSTLTLTISNPAANTVAESGVAVSDTFPSGLEVASPPNATNTCSGTFSPIAGDTTISLTSGTIATGGSCVVSVSVTSAIASTFINTTGTVSSTNGGTGLTASATLTVFGLPTQLAFGVQPTNTMAGGSITPAVTVKVEDINGNVVINGTGSTSSVVMSIGTNPSSGVLGGTTTVNAVAGVATFSGLSISAQGNGYTLVATSSGLNPATSNTFNITAPQVTYIQPFNSGHGWTYTQTSCAVGLFGSCSSGNATGGNCASTPCVDAGVFAGAQVGASQTGYFHSPIGTYTWQTLGIPPNSTVVSVQGGWSDKAVGTIGACATGTTAGIQIFDSTNTMEITTPSVFANTQVGGDTSVTVHNLGAAATVNTGSQATSTGITLRFNLNDDSATIAGICTLYGDTFELLINYTVGSPASGRRGQVIVVWNRQPDGTMSQAWAYNVELSGDSAEPLTLADLKLVSNGRSGFVLDSSALEGNGRHVTKQATE